MHAVEIVLGAGWAAFWLYWLAMAFTARRGRVFSSRQVRVRVLVFAVSFVVVRSRVLGRIHLATDPWRAGLGLGLFALGLALAVWARVHIGRNWGTPMTQREDPQLVTSGPYAVVRHPIYSGILAAGVGTAVALAWLVMVPVAVAGAYFVYSASAEERYLAEQLPDTYPPYKRSTAMLVPFVL